MDLQQATRDQGPVRQGRMRDMGVLGTAACRGWLSHPGVTQGHPHGFHWLGLIRGDGVASGRGAPGIPVTDGLPIGVF